MKRILYTISLIVGLGAFAQTPIADYTFTGNSNDESGNGYNGTASGATPTTDRFGVADNAYFFGGSSSMTFANTASLDFGDNITVAAWIKSSAYGTDGSGEPEFLSNGGGSTGFDFKLSGGTSTEKGLKAEIFGTGVFLITGSLELDTWYHVAFTYERNGSMILYLNGQEIGSTAAVDQGIAVSTNDLVAGNAMNGSIDDLKIYNSALTPAEITTIFSDGLSPEPGAQATNMVFANNSGACFSYDFTASTSTDLSGYLHVFNAVESPTFVPQDGVTYSADIGTPISGDNFISNVGNITSGNLCSQPETTYFYKIYAYNGSGETINYLTENPLTAQVTTLGNPTITSFTPVVANEGDQITITGTNFSETASNNEVMVGGKIATISGTPTNESITVIVPDNATSGPVTVRVGVGLVTGSNLTATGPEDFIREDPHALFTFTGNTLDDSGNGNDGTASGGSGLTTDRFGNADAAFSFDGVDAAVITSDLGVQPTQLTMSTWFYFEEGGADATHQLMELQGTAALALSEGQFQGVLNINSDFEVTNTAVTPGEWHFGTMTYDGVTMRTYLDGQLVAEIVNSAGILYPFAETILQMGASFSENYFNGWLDNVQFHGRALSASEIEALYDDNPRATLMALYNSTDGDNWTNNTNWGTNADLSTWHGIGTSAGLITTLDLRFNNLNGTIPAEVGDLQALNTLIFFNNQSLGGSIPPELGNLSNVTNFNISLCNMSGTIPVELGNLTNVSSFSLSRNQLSGAIPAELASLPNLNGLGSNGLYLYQNQFTSLPDMTGLPAGTRLRVYDNRIGFDDILTNLPLIDTGSDFLYAPQSVDSEEILTPAESESVTLTTSETAAGTSYQWFYNGAEINGATSASYNFTFTSTLEGTYHVQMTNSNVPDLTITRDPYLVSDGVNAAPSAISVDTDVLKEGLPIGTLVTTFTTTDVDPVDSYTYELVSGTGDGFNNFFTISGDQLLTAVEINAESTPSLSFRVRTTDSGGEQFEDTFSMLVAPIVDCNYDVLTASSGSFSDGSGDFDYENNFNCHWLIQLAEGQQVKLEFTDFNTEQDFDFVYVYDGEDANAPLLAQLSGASLPEAIISSSNSMFINFVTDGGVTATGWDASYSTLAANAFYPFDGNANDISGNGNNGTVAGTSAGGPSIGTNRFGQAGTSFVFNGSTSFMQAPSNLTSNAPFSIVTWVKWDGNTADFTEIVSWLVEASTAKVYLGTSSGSGIIRFGDTWSTGIVLPANRWVQVGATYDGSFAHLYLDGELVATSDADRLYDFASSDLYVGRQGVNDGEYFGGNIDDLRIYSEQLSASQVKNLYDAEQTSLLAAYNFSGNLNDDTGNGFSATVGSTGNAFSLSRLGFSNEAYDFDNTTGGYIDVQNIDGYDFGDQMTVTAWIRPDNYDASTVQIMSNVNTNTGFEFQLTSGDLSAEDLNTKRRLWGGIPDVSFGDVGEVLLDRWTHVAFRYQTGVGTSLFINGVNMITYGFIPGTEDSVITVSTIPILIGTGFDGLMDEVKIFNSALSDQEIYNDFEANRWPFHSLALRGPEGQGSSTIDQGLDLDNEGDGYIKALDIALNGTYQFRATGDNFESFMGDNELDGIAEPGSTQITLTPGFYAVGFDQTSFGYYIEEILSVGFIGSALTGDEDGWLLDDIDMTHLGNRVYELKNLTLFDGQWKLRINDAWGLIDWGSNNQDGNLNYFGANIDVGAGKYNLTVDLLNNTYSLEEVAGLVAQYNFDGGTATDITGNGYDGVNMNSPQYSVDRFGSAASTFEPGGNGTFVQITHNGDWDMQGAVTLNGWIRPNQYQSVDFGYTIFRDDNFGELDVSPNGSLFYHWNQNGSGDFGTLGTVAEDVLVNQWNMVSLVIGSNDYVKLYINGELQKVSLNEGATNVDSIQITRHVGVGGAAYFGDSDQTESGNRWFNGSIDDFRIYLNDELSAEEILEIYESELSGGLDERVAYFPFNAGSLLDESGNSYEGQFRDVSENVIAAATAMDRFGEADGALSFDNTGNSNHVFHERSINLSNDFTVNMWINPNSFASTGQLGDVLIANGLEGRFMTYENGILAYHYPSNNDVDYPSVATETDVVKLSEWQMVTYSIDNNGSIRLYHNGQLITSGDVSDQKVGTPDRFILAQPDAVDATDERFYDGAIDDVAIYQRILTDAEVAALFSEEVLIADYPFNGNANDKSGNGNDATVTGAALTNDRFGNPESAYAFAGGTDHIKRTDANFLEGLSQGSVSFWVNTNSISTEQLVLVTGTTRFYISDEGRVIADLFTDGTGASMGTVVLDANTWNHIVLTYDGSMARLYRNGTVAVENASSGLMNSGSTFFVGSDTGGGLDGEADDIKIYSYALSQEDIDALYTEGGSQANDIISFTIEGQVGDAVIDANAHTVSVEMPFGTDPSSLIPTIGISDLASINPASGVAQDFSDVVTYTVTAEDGSAQDWEVTITVLPNDQTELISFSLDGNTGTINSSENTVAVEVANGTDLTALIASFEVSEGGTASIGGTVQESGTTSNDYTNPVTYRVTAQDETNFTDWTVTVTEAAADAKEILAFSFPEQEGVTSIASIDATTGTVDLDVAFGTDVTSLVADFAVSGGASVAIDSNPQVSGETVNNFTNPLVYVVSATDASTKNWTVTVGLAANTATDITSFTIENQVSDESIDFDNHTIAIDMPFGTDVTSLTPSTIDLSSGATVSPDASTAQDFTNAVTYTVTAGDGVTAQDWSVSVNVLANRAPTALELDNTTVSENQSSGTLVGTFTTTDPDPSQTSFTYDLVSGTGDTNNNDFTIVGDELQTADILSLADGASRSILVRTDDGANGQLLRVFTITVTESQNVDSDFSSFNTPSSQPTAGQPFNISVTVTDVQGVGRVDLYHRGAGASSFTGPEEMSADGDVYSFSMADGNLNNQGVQYFMQAVDAVGNTTDTGLFFTARTVDDQSQSLPTSTVRPGITVQDYRIVAFPYEGLTVSDITDDLVGSDASSVRVLQYDGATADPFYRNASSLSPGNGYWLIFKDYAEGSSSIDIGGTSVSLNESGVFVMDLREGFNLIGNPFLGSLNWAGVLSHNEAEGIISSGEVSNAAGYNGSYTSRSTLSVYEGAFINVTRSGGVQNFEIPLSAVSGRANETYSEGPKDVFVDDAEWNLRFFLETPTYSYKMGSIGLNEQALDDSDKFDFPLLPKFSTYLEQVFADGNTGSVKQSSHFKEWTFQLPNNLPEGEINVSWDIPVSSRKTLLLVDGASNKVYDLSKTRSINLPNNPEATHRIYYGDQATIWDSIDLPFDVLYSVYPNPVENQFTLEVYAAEEKSVEVELVSLSGKTTSLGRVSLQKGLSSRRIDLTQNEVKNGIYFIKVGGEVMTKIFKK